MRTYLTASLVAAFGFCAVGGAVAFAAAPHGRVPTGAEVRQVLREATEFSRSRSGGFVTTHEHLHRDGTAVVVCDGHGGLLTAIPVVRWPSADGHGQYVLFWDNGRFLGSNTLAVLPTLGPEAASLRIVGYGPDRIVIRYAVYRPSDPMYDPSLPPKVVRYSWSGTRLCASATVPKGAFVKNLIMRLEPPPLADPSATT